MTKYGFAINLHRCIGCRTCTVACKMEHHLAEGIQRMRVLNDSGTTTYDVPAGDYPSVSFAWRPVPCQHCDNAPCVSVCPTGATFKRDDGIVMVDEDVCIGCGTCVDVCPYGARQLDPVAQIVQKCSLCAHRLDAGVGTTICQITCPNRAITVGDMEDLSSDIAQILADYETTHYLEEQGTAPQVYYYSSVEKQTL